jgi:hypothetical protein
MEVIGQLNPQGKNIFNRKLGGPQSQPGHFTDEKKQMSILGNKMLRLQMKIPMPLPVTVIFKGLFCNGKKIQNQ